MSQADLDRLAIDRDGELPIGLQLAWALRARVCDGRLSPGERLPGVREMAEIAGVNANTVRAVYQRLEREGLIESRHGTGTFVGSAPGRSEAGELAADVARQARERGMDPRQVAAALYVAPQDAEQRERPAVGPSGGAERRRGLRGQIAALEQALAEIETANPGLLAPPAEASPPVGPRLLSAQELEDVKARLVRRLADAQLALDARAVEAEAETHRASTKARQGAPKGQPAVQSPVPTDRPARSKTLATVKLATP